MGQKISVPEQIHRAAKLNDIGELQAICADMRINRALDAATKQSWLNWTDEEGRTALMWACQKNHLHVAQLLLDEGADIHAIAPKRTNGGSALAEAIAGKHEALVELLLRHGADPFTENPAGKTPLDVALEARAVNIVRACERQALFAGHVSTRVGQLKGFSYTNKDRWVVIAPRFTPPPPGGSVGEVRVMMLLFRNAAEADPRTKVWLDGAAISMRDDEALLRLHPNHVQPRNIHTQYEGGWVMFFRPARAQGFVPSGALPAPQNPDAAFAAFLATSSRPLEQLQQQQQLRMAAAAANPWAHNTLSTHPAATVTPTAQAAGPYAGPSGGGYGPPPQQMPPLQQPYMHAGLQMQPAAAPPSTSFQQHPQAAAGLMAAPGESDEAFAQRLAAMYGSSAASTPGGSHHASPPSTSAPSAANSNAPSRLGSSTAQPQQQQQDSSSSNPFRQQQQQLPQPYPSSSVSQATDNPFRTHGASSGSQPQQQQQLDAARVSDGGVPSAPAAPGGPTAAAAAVPAAVPAAAAVSAGSSGFDAGASDADLCVICLNAPREVGLLHGASVHKCLCKECAPMVRVGTPCPMCRQNVERVLGVY